MNEKLFPIDLLEGPIDDRIRYFENYVVAHPTLITAYKELLERIDVTSDNNILLVYGPSGVGKSTLFSKIIKHIYEDNIELIHEDKGFIPVVGIEAISPENGTFDWIDFYTRILHSANEPLVEHKVRFDETGIKKSGTKRALRQSIENVLKYRHTKVVLIDEAQHMTKVGSGRSLINQMDAIKSLASTSKVPIILFGTYGLLQFRNLSGQLSRRGMDVHLRRYRADIEEEKNAFINVLLNFQKRLPLEEEPNLVENWEYFYSRTIGCIGILKDWIYRTYKNKLKTDESISTLDIDDFTRFALTPDQCIKMAEEVILDEKKIASLEHDSKLYSILNLDKVEQSKQNIDKEKPKRDIGERNPKRDPVGVEGFEEAK